MEFFIVQLVFFGVEIWEVVWFDKNSHFCFLSEWVQSISRFRESPMDCFQKRILRLSYFSSMRRVLGN